MLLVMWVLSSPGHGVFLWFLGLSAEECHRWIHLQQHEHFTFEVLCWRRALVPLVMLQQ
jgi:hypothetical protein